MAQNCFERFKQEYDVVRMSGASLLVVNIKTRKEAYIHRNAFNALAIAEDYRVTSRMLKNNKAMPWIEVLVWKAL